MNEKLTTNSGLNKRAELLSLEDFCQYLSVTTATGRNWLKLGKVTPQLMEGKQAYFSLKYAQTVKKGLEQGNNPALKSRRNKTYISGSNVYNSYVSEKARALDSVHTLLERIERNRITAGEKEIRTLLGECAVQLLCQKMLSPETPKQETACQENLKQSQISLKQKELSQKTVCQNAPSQENPSWLQAYLEDRLDLKEYGFLVDDLLPGPKRALNWIRKNKDVFDISFHYEACEDVLGLLYISLKNLGSRKATGAYYTPTKIVRKLCVQLFGTDSSVCSDKSILDPCCGTGNFLLQLPDRIPFDSIYGSDIDKLSIQIARINMALKYGVSNKKTLYSHIFCRNYLEKKESDQYAYIIGNPPWGYAFSPEEKKKLRETYISASGNTLESYDLFVEQALKDLQPQGSLAFVLPEAFLNVKSHMPVRKVLADRYRLSYVEYLGDPFSDVHCPCIILQIRNDQSASIKDLLVKNNKKEFRIQEERKLNPECFSFLTDDKEYALLKKISNPYGKCFLKDHADFALGIVTGNNKKCISSEKTEENERILRGSDLQKYRYRKTDQYIVFKPGEFQQAAKEEFYRAPEKLLYKFISKQLVFAYDDQQMLSLNSCNLLIPHLDEVPVKYVMAILNSRIAQYYFSKTFNSVKVLRSHIQQIPIPLPKEKELREVLRYTEILIYDTDPVVWKDNYDALDLLISELFGLTKEEYEQIKEEQ